MTFISYAQNFEDVVLWRALKHVESGFYIDVGAAHPDDYSVTRAFYDRGWRGINVEPTSRVIRLTGARPRDINLHMAVGGSPGELTLFVVEDNKDISTVDPVIAEAHRAAGWTTRESRVPVATLADIWREHVKTEVHFLKIDAEGAEREVLLGADLERFRPWIVIVEATAPDSQIPTHTAWEDLLTAANYRFAWFDALNRFYIAQERWETLSPSFTVPPNIFDDFIRATDTEHLSKIIAAEAHLARLEANLAEANATARRAEADGRQAEEDARREAEAAAARMEIEVARSRREAEAAAAQMEIEVARSRREAEAVAAQMEIEVARSAAVRAAENANHRAAEERAAAAWRRTAIAESKAGQAQISAATAQDWLEAMRASASWRLTAPLRALSQFARDGMTRLARRRTPPFSASPDAFAAPTPAVQPNAIARDVSAALSSAIYDATYKNRRSGIRERSVARCRGRVLFDVSTSLAWRGAHAVGIVRTERELAARLLNDLDLAVLPVVFHGGALRVLEPELARSIVAAGATEPLARKQLAPPRGSGLEPPSDLQSADFSLVAYPNESDLLLCAGLGWDVIDWGLIGTLRRSCNLRIVSMLYDLIPVKYPEMLGQSTNYYANYFLNILDECSLTLCISECTRQDLMEFAARTGRPEPAAEVVRLGANVPASPSMDEFTDGGLRDRLARKRFALSVGTFEIRKNYRLLIDLWHELVDDVTFDLDLVIVGMAGWCVEDVLARLRLSPLFGNRIFWFQGISDAALSWLYDTCHIFLFPSLYEGWGLPVVEALQHGRPAIVSNRGAVPEASLGIAQIIDPDDRQAWRRAIVAEAQSPRRQVLARMVPKWDDTVDAVKQHLLKALEIAV